MMVLTKRVGDSPESNLPSLQVRAHNKFYVLVIIMLICRPLSGAFRQRSNRESGQLSALHPLQ